MAEVMVKCANPQCPASYKVDEAILGRRARCKRCRTPFVLTRAEKQASASTPSPTGPDTGVREERRHGADGVPESWEVGDVILDLYEVRRVLGEGGMGKVHLVHHRGWQTELAVKSVRPDRLKSRRHLEDFQREAEVWVNKIGLHPHVVSCHYVRVLGGLPRVFIDYVDGGSLRDWVRSGKLYEGGPEKSLERILDIAIQFAWGLDYAHERGLIHQDVKPDNVMMTKDGTARVTDFGIARAREAAGERIDDAQPGQSLVVPGVGLCTREYASPEQLGKQSLTRRTDVWSWAVSLLEMFIPGLIRKGFLGPAAPQALEQYLRDGAMVEGAPQLPAEMAALLRDCLQKAPDARPRTMLHIADALRAIYKAVTGSDFSREQPRPADALADELNNRAVSLLDLGKQTEAEKMWQEALDADPHHPQATYNSGLIRWRSATLDDAVMLANLRAVAQTRPGDWLPVQMIAHVHLERGDCEQTRHVLEQITGPDAERVETRALEKLAEQLQSVSRRCLRTFEGHSDSIRSLALRGDGSLAISGSSDKALKLWEVATGRCLRTFTGHADEVTSVYFSADNRLALSGSDDKTLQLWELSTGRSLRSFHGHTDKISSVCLSSDARFALSASWDLTLKLWDVSTGLCVRTFPGHTGTVKSVCLSSDGLLALSSSADSTVKLWEVSTGACLRTFLGHGFYVDSVCWSSDNRLILSGSWDRTLKLWEASTGHCLRTFRGHTDNIHSVCLSRDGRFALSGGADRTLRLWEVSTGRCLCSFPACSVGITTVCLSRDSQSAISGGYDRQLKLWNLAPEWSRIVPLYLSQPQTAEASASASDTFQKELAKGLEALNRGAWNVAGTCLGRARQEKGYDLHPQIQQAWPMLYTHLPRREFRTGYPANTIKAEEWISSVRLSSDGRFALSEGGGKKPLKLWEVSTGRCLCSLAGEKHRHVYSMCLSDDARFALSGWMGELTLWDLSTGRCLRKFKGHKCAVTTVCLSTDGRFALSGEGVGPLMSFLSESLASEIKLVKLWEVSTGRCVRSFAGHTTDVSSVCLSSDTRFALSASWDKTVKLWEVSTGTCLRTFQGHTSTINAVCLSSDDRLVLSGSSDSTLKLWELSTGACLGTFTGHTSSVNSVCLSSDGRFALSGGDDRTVRLWDVSTGRCLRSFEEHTDSVKSVCLSGDTRFALSGGGATMRVWFLDWDLEIRELADWDEGARSYLRSFLAQHTPYLAVLSQDDVLNEAGLTRALTRQGKPCWTDDDFQHLLYTLGCAGYGWLRPEGVRRELVKMAANWQGPPALI